MAGPPTADDLPAEKAGYALRDLSRLIAACAGHGANIGIYAERLLDDPLPWTRMRSVYRLLGWSAATAPARSRPPADGHSTSTW